MDGDTAAGRGGTIGALGSERSGQRDEDDRKRSNTRQQWHDHNSAARRDPAPATQARHASNGRIDDLTNSLYNK